MSYSSDYGPEYGRSGSGRPAPTRPQPQVEGSNLPALPTGTRPGGPSRPGGPGGPGGSGGSGGGGGPGRRRPGGGGDGTRRGSGKKAKRKGWRRLLSWKLWLAVFGIGTLASICGVGVAYAMVKVPAKPNADVMVQGSTVYYRDNKPMVHLGSSRVIVKISQISEPMRWAALAAEDRHFYQESAISPTGIGRALINNLSGGDTQGGSTITQQYVKNAYLTQQRTFTRKFKEIFIAIKVGKQQKKDEILENYLNTIYFGYHANGVEAAAETYYGVHASQLTVPQAAVLAANIKQPQYYDPRSKGQQHIDAVQRYNFVLDGMVKMGKLSQADFAKYQNKPPITKKNKLSSASKGQKGFLIQRVTNALHGMGYTDTQIENGGLKVYTTWDKDLQEQARKTVEGDLKAKRMPADTRVGLVTINPTNGEILAAYGGKDYLNRAVDDAYYSTAQVGSSFKPFVLAAALKEGIGLKSKFDAHAPQWFTTDGKSVPKGTPGAMHVVNDEGNLPGPVDLVTATAKSLNTVFVPLGFKAQSDNVFSLAEKAGLPASKMESQRHVGGFFLGQTDMSPLNLASGYATIANDGVAVTPHSIDHVITPDHKVHKFKAKRQEAFPEDVAHDTQYAMQHVVQTGGTGYRAAIPGRQIAGKTGTTNDNAAAWFSGFTPKQMVTTVGMWRYTDSTAKTRRNKTAGYHNLQHVGIYQHINGGDLPAEIWHDYMTQAVQKLPVKSFAGPDWVGNTQLFATPSPTATTPSPTPTPTCGPGQVPEIDNCKPSKTKSPGPDQCTRFPNLPQCHSKSPKPGHTCKPWEIPCGSTPTTANPPNGDPNAQERAARRFRE